MAASPFDRQCIKSYKESQAQISASSGYKEMKSLVDQNQTNMESEKLALPSVGSETALTEATVLPLVEQQLQVLYPSLEPSSAEFQMLAQQQTHFMLKELYNDSNIASSMQNLTLQNTASASQSARAVKDLHHQSKPLDFPHQTECLKQLTVKSDLELLTDKFSSGTPSRHEVKQDQQVNFKSDSTSRHRKSRFSNTCHKNNTSSKWRNSDNLSNNEEQEKKGFNSTGANMTKVKSCHTPSSILLEENWDDVCQPAYHFSFNTGFKYKTETVPSIDKTGKSLECHDQLENCSSSEKFCAVKPKTPNAAVSRPLEENWDAECDPFPKTIIGCFKPEKMLRKSSSKGGESDAESRSCGIPGMGKPVAKSPAVAQSKPSRCSTEQRLLASGQSQKALTEETSDKSTSGQGQKWVKVGKKGKATKKCQNKDKR